MRSSQRLLGDRILRDSDGPCSQVVGCGGPKDRFIVCIVNIDDCFRFAYADKDRRIDVGNSIRIRAA